MTDCVFLAADIDSYIEYLAITYPDICQTEVIGKSFEGRDMKLLKVSTGSESNKPAIWIDGGEYVSTCHINHDIVWEGLLDNAQHDVYLITVTLRTSALFP